MGGTVVVNGPITTATSDESDNWSEIVEGSGTAEQFQALRQNERKISTISAGTAVFTLASAR